MKLFLRILVTIIMALMAFFFINVISLFPLGAITAAIGRENAEIMVLVASLLCAVAMSIFVWGKFPLYMDKNSYPGFASSIFLSGTVLAATSAFIFLVVVLTYDPTAGLAPFAAFFMVAPVAFIIGGIWGGVRWWMKRKK